MELDPKTHQKYTKIATTALWSTLGLVVALSLLNGLLKSDGLIPFISLAFGLFMLAGSARAALFANSPTPGRVPIMLRIVYGFMLAFLLFIGALWLVVMFIFNR